MTEANSEVRLSYQVVSVKRTEAPPGAEGSSWHRYVISYRGSENIEGCRQGSLDAVTGVVEALVAQLNERHKGKHGRVHIVPTPKKVATSPDK